MPLFEVFLASSVIQRRDSERPKEVKFPAKTDSDPERPIPPPPSIPFCSGVEHSDSAAVVRVTLEKTSDGTHVARGDLIVIARQRSPTAAQSQCSAPREKKVDGERNIARSRSQSYFSAVGAHFSPRYCRRQKKNLE